MLVSMGGGGQWSTKWSAAARAAPNPIAAAVMTPKWAAGISDTLLLGLLVEGFGKGLPIVGVPYSNRAQISFPAIQEGLRKLSGWGVTIVIGEGEPHERGTGEARLPHFPWQAAWKAFLEHPRRTGADHPN
ncbi:hypothetical protein IU470_15920 [Nocardia abscessus]|uniref:Flavoprotein domain-containing protein n=1 Tax=Nocardia abscessus TaxID=120957 RepID=A0ABS0C8U6_9NOCA|nr:hypothetical protein [Nocardia abscessus]MBF6226581.1 hypothetical protein [Nocardia abscessus]